MIISLSLITKGASNDQIIATIIGAAAIATVTCAGLLIHRRVRHHQSCCS